MISKWNQYQFATLKKNILLSFNIINQMDANSNNRNTNGVGGGGANDGGNNMQEGGGGGTQGGTGGKGATPGKKFIIQRMNDAFFTVMVELLKRKHISTFWACVMIVFMFCQINSILFNSEVFDWNDQYFADYVYTFSDYIHIHDAIQRSRNALYFQILFYIAFLYNLLLALSVVYLYYALQHPKIYLPSIVGVMQFMFLLVYSVLFFPFFDSMISIFKCDGEGRHYILSELVCYSSTHTGMVIIAIIGIILMIIISLLIATLYNETQPVKEDALSRLDSNFEWIMLAYRIAMSVISLYCYEDFCKWIVIVISLLSSVYFLQQYFVYLPYYNSTVSIVFGSMLGVYFWISLNALLMELWGVKGQLTVIFLGIPIVVLVMRYLREQKIYWLMSTTLDKFQRDIDCLNQIITLQDWHTESQKTNSDVDKEIMFKGLINQHILECESYECVCSNVEDLYDSQNDKYLCLANFGIGEFEYTNDELLDDEENYQLHNRNYINPQKSTQRHKKTRSTPAAASSKADPSKQLDEIHRSDVFIQNFMKQLYKDSLNKFITSVSIHILFAYYYFEVMRNVHAALHELKIASKKKPNVFQQFTIYRYQSMIEQYVKTEGELHRHVYGQLTNVKEFERLYQEMARQIEKVCNHIVEFWTQLASVIPDLNFLNNLNNQIVDASQEAERFWNMMCKINANYSPALTMYGEYLTFIMNNTGAGKVYFDKAEKVSFGHKANHGEHGQSNEVLFSDEAVIIHISGNKGDSGRVIKTSQGLKKVFGFDRSEVHGQNVSLLMSNIFANKHNAFLEQFYQTARKVMFNKERSLFAQHKTGYCFQIHIIIKQMPSLTEGVQYVGLIKPQTSDNDYIITDLNGYIDSCTPGIGQHFNNSAQNGNDQYNYKPSYISIFDVLVKETTQFNIQYLAPELVYFFNNKNQLSLEQFDPNASGSSNNFKTYSQFANGNNGVRRVGDVRQLNTKFSTPGGDKLTFYIPQNLVQIIKTESNNRGGGGNRQNKSQGGVGRYAESAQGGTNAASISIKGRVPLGSVGLNSQNNDGQNKISNHFREFIRFVQKTGKSGGANRRINPGLKEILGCKEYKEFEIKKTLMVEIKEWNIPLGNQPDRGIKVLLFKIPKNQADLKPDEYSFEKSLKENYKNLSISPSEYNKQQTGRNGPLIQEQKTINSARNPTIQKTVTIRQPNHKDAIQSTKQPNHHKASETLGGLPPPALKTKNTMKNTQVQRNLSFSNANSFNQSKSIVKQAISFVEGEGNSNAVPSGGLIQGGNPGSGQPTLTATSAKLKPFGETPNGSGGSQMIISSARDLKNESFRLMILEEKPNQHSRQGGSSNNADFKEDQHIDIDLLKFERQETDDMDEDDQEQLETERIDVKKDIALNDEMKDRGSMVDVAGGISGAVGGGESISVLPQTSKANKKADTRTDQITKNNTAGNENLSNIPSVQKLFIDRGNNSDGNVTSTLGPPASIPTRGIPVGYPQFGHNRESARVKPPKPTYVSKAHATDIENLPQVETLFPLLSKKKNTTKGDSAGSKQPTTNDPEDYDYGDEEGFEDEYGEEGFYGEDGEYYDEGDYDDEEYGEEQEDVLQNIDNDIRPASGGLNIENSQSHQSHRNDSYKNSLAPSGRSTNYHRPSVRKSRGLNGSLMFKAPSGYEMVTSTEIQKSPSSHQIGSISIREPPVPLQRKKNHDYSRIVTNKKYVPYDEDQETCGSAYFNDCNACENEIEIRKTIQKTQVTVVNRLQTKKTAKRSKTKTKIFERSMTTSEWKKNNARVTSFQEDEEELLNESGVENSGTRKTGAEGAEGPKGEGVQRQLQQSVSRISEDLEDEGQDVYGGMTTQATSHRTTNDDTAVDEGEGEASSIASSMQSQMRTYQSLKQAIDERYVPTSIKNLRFVANLVWLAVLLLSVAYFIIQATLFTEIQNYVSIIVNSEKRVDDIMTINLKLTDIAMLNEDILTVNSTIIAAQANYALNNSLYNKQNVINYYIEEFELASTQLLDSQTSLSLSTADLDEEARVRINPSGVTLQYFDYLSNGSGGSNLPTKYDYNVWEAIVQITMFAYRLAESPSEIFHNNTQVRFIAYNCMNSVLSALRESTQAIVDQSEQARQSNNNTFLVLVISVSGALFLSMAFLLPVIKRAKDNKQEVLILLTNKKVQKNIEEQLKRTRWFISKYIKKFEAPQDMKSYQGEYDEMIGDHHGSAGGVGENIHAHTEKDLRGGQKEDKQDDYISKVQQQKKKWRPLNSNFFSITLRFILILLAIESYFLYSYLLSKAFLLEVSELTKELRLLISRLPQLEFALLMQKELLYSNASATFLYTPVQDIAESSLKTQNLDYQELLKLFQSNYNFHTASYNEQFESLIYQDLCLKASSLYLNTALCKSLNEGIQGKGVYSAVVKFWNNLSQVLNDFLSSARGLTEQKAQLNSQIINEQQQMLQLYMKPYHQLLGERLKDDIDTAFNNEFASNQTVFAFFILYVVFVYLIVWRLFMRNLLEELWRAKSCLQLLPVELCFRIEDIRAFIYRNSSGLSGNMS